MIWFFTRGSAQIDFEVRRLPETGGFAMIVNLPDGTERTEAFDDPGRLIGRVLAAQQQLIEEGWVPSSPIVAQRRRPPPIVSRRRRYLRRNAAAISITVTKRLAAAFGRAIGDRARPGRRPRFMRPGPRVAWKSRRLFVSSRRRSTATIDARAARILDVPARTRRQAGTVLPRSNRAPASSGVSRRTTDVAASCFRADGRDQVQDRDVVLGAFQEEWLAENWARASGTGSGSRDGDSQPRSGLAIGERSRAQPPPAPAPPRSFHSGGTTSDAGVSRSPAPAIGVRASVDRPLVVSRVQRPRLVAAGTPTQNAPGLGRAGRGVEAGGFADAGMDSRTRTMHFRTSVVKSCAPPVVRWIRPRRSRTAFLDASDLRLPPRSVTRASTRSPSRSRRSQSSLW